MKALIIPKFNLTAPVKDYDLVFKLDENFVQQDDMFCFIPNRQIRQQTKQNICFVPYGPRSFDYKQAARAILNNFEDNSFVVVETDITFPFHQEIGLSHLEEMHILSILIMFLLHEKIDNITLLERVPMSKKEEDYINKLIQEKKIKLLNE